MRNSPIRLVICLICPIGGVGWGCSAHQWAAGPTGPTLLFEDSGTQDWRDKWFLDGERASVINGPGGMELRAGPEPLNDTCHAVLWTRTSFSGDLVIEYDYTRTDTSTRFVNILYFMARGRGNKAFPADISRWNHERVVPHMRTYFNHMEAYHISYAAYGPDADSAADDYVRLRRYDPTRGGLKGTAVPEDHFTTGLFKPFETYRIRVSKSGRHVTMRIEHLENKATRLVCEWEVPGSPNYTAGRVGFRHMFTRSARYGNIRIWSAPAAG